MPEYKHRGVCYRECYWKETLWKPGEVYEGDDLPGKYFNTDGKSPELPPETAAADPRSNKEIREILSKKYNSSLPKSASRKKLWQRLHEFEIAESKDALTDDPKKPGRSKKQ